MFHQSIETRIDEVVVRHVDDKLNAMLQVQQEKQTWKFSVEQASTVKVAIDQDSDQKVRT